MVSSAKRTVGFLQSFTCAVACAALWPGTAGRRGGPQPRPRYGGFLQVSQGRAGPAEPLDHRTGRYHGRVADRPDLTGLRDQADATNDEALSTAVFAMTASSLDGRAGVKPLNQVSPFDVLMRERLADWVASGQARYCPHFPGGDPRDPVAPMVLWYDVPGTAMACPDCIGYVVNRIVGTDEDRRCDICRTVQEKESTWSQRKMIIDGWVHEGTRQVMPAVVVNYIVCMECQILEQQPAARPAPPTEDELADLRERMERARRCQPGGGLPPPTTVLVVVGAQPPAVRAARGQQPRRTTRAQRRGRK